MTTAASTPCTAAQAPSVAPVAAPTEEQLRMAYRHLCRPGWPTPFEAAMAKLGYRTAITQVARNMHRQKMTSFVSHSLPKMPAPPTPGARELTGPQKYGRSPYSKVNGPKTELTNWRRSGITQQLAGTHSPKPAPFDHKKAAANDLGD